MISGGVEFAVLAHNQHWIGIGVRFRLDDVLRGKHLLVEIEPDDIVFVGKSLNKSLGRVALDGDFHRAVEVLAQLLEQVILVTNHGTVIDKVVGSVVKDESGDCVAVYSFLFFVLVFDRDRDMHDTPIPNDERC